MRELFPVNSFKNGLSRNVHIRLRPPDGSLIRVSLIRMALHHKIPLCKCTGRNECTSEIFTLVCFMRVRQGSNDVDFRISVNKLVVHS